MAQHLRLLGDRFARATVPAPALDADAVEGDGFPLAAPSGVPVCAFSGAGVEPGAGDGPGAGSVFAAFDAGREGGDRGGGLEEVAQCAGGAGGVRAGGAGCVCGGGEDVFVGLEDEEEAAGLFGDEFLGSCP